MHALNSTTPLAPGRPVAFVIPSLERGGTERQLLYLLEALALHHPMLVLCSNHAGAWGDAAARYAEVRELGCRTGWDPRLGPRCWRALRDYRPDVVHTFLFGFDYAAAAAARRAGVAAVLSSRRELASWQQPRHLRMQRRANDLVDAVVANSQAVAEFARVQEHAPPQLFRVIPNAVDPARFRYNGRRADVRERLGFPSNAPVIGMVANFSPVKDHRLFLEIAAALLRRRKDAYFLLAGDGPLRQRIWSKAAAMGLNGRVLFRSDLAAAEMYAAMDVHLLCSRAEGSPNAVLEAMAAGVPNVAAAVGGIPELLLDGAAGRLVATRDPHDFAEAANVLLMNSAKAAELTARALTAVLDRHSLRAFGVAHRVLYGELAAAAVAQPGAG